MDDMQKTEGTIEHPMFGEMTPEEYRAYLLSCEEVASLGL